MSVRYAGPVACSLWSWSVMFAGFGSAFLYLDGSFDDVSDESVGVLGGAVVPAFVSLRLGEPERTG